MYEHIIQSVQSTPWAILPEKLAIIRNILVMRHNGYRYTPDEVKAEIEAARQGERQIITAGNSIAVIPVFGTIVPRGNMFLEASGAVSVQSILGQFREAMNNQDVGSIVLNIDSPGGQVGGIAELATEIYEARGQKQIIAVANGLAASAAYWLASSAGEIVVTPSGEVGSIGVFAIHEDHSAALEADGIKTTIVSAGKYKTEGNPFEPLSDEAKGAAQSRVNEFYDMFTQAVAKGRNVSISDVVGGFGEGRVVSADKAVRLGMADRVATIDQVIDDLSAGKRRDEDTSDRKRRMRAFSR